MRFNNIVFFQFLFSIIFTMHLRMIDNEIKYIEPNKQVSIDNYKFSREECKSYFKFEMLGKRTN